jgi:hypothetical protein
VSIIDALVGGDHADGTQTSRWTGDEVIGMGYLDAALASDAALYAWPCRG